MSFVLALPVQPSRSFGSSGSFCCGRLAGLIPGDPPQAPQMRFGATLTQFWVLEVVSLRPFGRSNAWRATLTEFWGQVVSLRLFWPFTD